MPPIVTTALLALVCLLLLAAMRWGWRRRAGRSAALVPELPAFPAPGDPLLGAARTAPIEATYVSSTTAGDWLERVVAFDLGVRSSAVVQVHDGGVLVARTGARDLFIPAAAVRGVRTAPGMAGKFVGGDGLVVLTWQAPGSGTPQLDTGLRLRHRSDKTVLTEAVEALAPATQTSADQSGATRKENT